MVIYADILVLVNIYIDYFLLLGVRRFLHLRVNTWRMVLGSVLGGLSGLLSLLPLPFAASFFLLLPAAALICFAVFWNGSPARYVKSTACFLAFSLLFSGLISLLIQIFALNAAVVGGRVYFDISPLLLLVFTILAYLVSLLLERIRGRSEPSSSYRRVIVEHQGGRVELFCKVDTGNDLREPFSGLPVLVAERACVEALLPKAVKGYLSHSPNGDGIRLIPYSTLGGPGLLPAFRPSRITEKKSGKPLNCFLAVFDGSLSASGYSALINPELLEFI